MILGAATLVPWLAVVLVASALDVHAWQLHLLFGLWGLGAAVVGPPSLLLTLPMAFAWRRETLTRANAASRHASGWPATDG